MVSVKQNSVTRIRFSQASISKTVKILRKTSIIVANINSLLFQGSEKRISSREISLRKSIFWTSLKGVGGRQVRLNNSYNFKEDILQGFHPKNGTYSSKNA